MACHTKYKLFFSTYRGEKSTTIASTFKPLPPLCRYDNYKESHGRPDYMRLDGSLNYIQGPLPPYHQGPLLSPRGPVNRCPPINRVPLDRGGLPDRRVPHVRKGPAVMWTSRTGD